MISLYEYILEAAIGNLGITFEEFCDYVNEVGSGKGVSKAFRKRFGAKRDYKLIQALDDTVTNFIADLNKMNVEVDETMLRFLYNQLCSLPSSKIDKILGIGEDGIAYGVNDKVIKCFKRGNIPAHLLKFYELCKTGKYDVLPRVYRIGKGYVVMERLAIRTKKCQDIIHTLHKDAGDDTLYHLIQDNKLEGVKLNGKQQEAVAFMRAIREPLDELGYGPTDYGDLHSDNLGERADGTVVYFDI